MIPFYKYHGTGNDFILLDNRDNRFDGLDTTTIKYWCDRHLGIGADGLMLLNVSDTYDFHMVYFNADGNESTMCGNGGRCIVQFAEDLGIHRDKYQFTAIDGLHEATITLDGNIRLKLNASGAPTPYNQDWMIHTGSPHLVCLVDDVDSIDVKKSGAAIRYSESFAQAGINVNFVQVVDAHHLKVRTYERGVEDETLSCGTGVTASALCFRAFESGQQRIKVETPGGSLFVDFIREPDGGFSEVWLTGRATFVFRGEIDKH
jgi:diaminopimelate epimerase